MMYAVYRVHKDYHNTMYFFTRSQAEEFAKAKNAEWDIIYKPTHKNVVELVERNGEW